MPLNEHVDYWVPANGGLEEWTRYRNGREYLYCWNQGRNEHSRHAWIGRDDIVYSSVDHEGCPCHREGAA